MAAASVASAASPPVLKHNHYSTSEERSDPKNRLDSLEDLNACSAPGSAAELLALRKRDHSSTQPGASTVREWLVDHQVGISFSYFVLLALVYALVPSIRSQTERFFRLSYHDEAAGFYTRGVYDFCYIATWTVAFTGLRAGVMTYLLYPLAERTGVLTQKAKVRFAEQGWLGLYYSLSYAAGMYIWYNSSYWESFANLWTDFPVIQLNSVEKYYYLIQYAFWVQQILIIHIEERRKDHWQMLVHHIVTCSLLATSYGYFQTRVGNVILCIMDGVDILLPIAKLLRYARYQTSCDIAFGVFILSWIYARHFVYMKVCWSIYADVPRVMQPGLYSSTTGQLLSTNVSNIHPTAVSTLRNVLSPFVAPGANIWYILDMRFFFLSMLLALQCLTLMWLALILRVAYNVIRGYGADDSRSEADEEEAVAAAAAAANLAASGVPADAPPLEQEVGVEGINLRRRAGTRKHKEAYTTSSGFSVASSGPKKELLGRIGCDKPT